MVKMNKNNSKTKINFNSVYPILKFLCATNTPGYGSREAYNKGSAMPCFELMFNLNLCKVVEDIRCSNCSSRVKQLWTLR